MDELAGKALQTGNGARRHGQQPVIRKNHEATGLELAQSLRALRRCHEQARADVQTIARLEYVYARLRSEVEQLKNGIQQLTLREAQARALAHYDELTGLANRRLLNDRLGQALAQAARHGREVALILLDLDDFKKVNDTLGHAAGDMVLRTVAARISAATRAADTVCRFGGDEFIIMLPEFDDRHTLATVIAKVRKTLTAPYRVAGRVIRMSASSGQVIFPRDADCSAALIVKADQDLYRSKTTCRKTVITTAPVS